MSITDTGDSLVGYKRGCAVARAYRGEGDTQFLAGICEHIESQNSMDQSACIGPNKSDIWEMQRVYCGFPLIKWCSFMPLEEQDNVLGRCFECMSSFSHYSLLFLSCRNIAEKHRIKQCKHNHASYDMPFTALEPQRSLQGTKNTLPGPDKMHKYVGAFKICSVRNSVTERARMDDIGQAFKLSCAICLCSCSIFFLHHVT